MGTTRLEAFSDGVIAIIITIMVLELKMPDGGDLQALKPVLPHLLSYVLSFVFLGIYWNNHHHLLHVTHRVSGGVMWANLHLLFWLSHVPAMTGWLGDHHQEAVPTALYGAVLFFSGIAFTILQRSIIAQDGKESPLANALGSDVKGMLSLGLYGASVLLAFVEPRISDALFVAVALMWLVPDRRIESRLARESEPNR